VFRVNGKGVDAAFEHEAGGHRWQMVSPTDKRGRVHTSTVTIAVLPEPREHELDIRDQDIEVETMRGSGAGGQHRNKTDSAVRITHLPTGVVVRCESERSQHLNRETAMAVLRAKILEAQSRSDGQARESERRRQVGSGQRGDKVRSIDVPEDRVTCHVTGRRCRYKDYERGRGMA
jgi:peptide chain release factor 1